MTRYTLNYNLLAILLEKFKTVDIDKIEAPKAGYERNTLDPLSTVAPNKTQVSYEDTKIKKGKKGYVKPKQRKDIKQFRDFHADKSVPADTSYADWKAGSYDSKPKQAPKTDLSSDYFEGKPDKMTTAMVPYKSQVPSTDVKKPEAPKPKKPKAKFSPEALYKTGDSDYTFMTAFDPNRFKKIGGAIQTARGLDDINQPIKKPKTFDIPKIEAFRPTLVSILIGN